MRVDLSKALDMSKSLIEEAFMLPGYTVDSFDWTLIVQSGPFDPVKKSVDYSDDEIEQLLYGKAKKVAMQFGGKTVNMTVERLQHLVDIGLDYLSLDRETDTLSGGESQRVKMVKHMSGSLVDVTYIFDESSVGLHLRDVHRLNALLQKLRDKGNTVIVVEHDPDVIKMRIILSTLGHTRASTAAPLYLKEVIKDCFWQIR